MDDLISRQAAIDALGERPMVWTSDDDYALGERNQYDIDRLAIETVPSAEQHGEWIQKSTGGESFYTCSKCGFIAWEHEDTNYCPNCGADMRGE